MKHSRRFTCGFIFALFAMVEGSGLNVVDGPISWQTGHEAALARPKWSVFLRPREIKGCYGYGAISKLCRITGLKSGPSSIPSFFEKQQAIYLRFCFAIFGMVEGSLSSPVNRHSFVSGSLTARLSAGPVGHFCPTGPYSSAIPAWFLLWESCPLRLGCGRCP